MNKIKFKAKPSANGFAMLILLLAAILFSLFVKDTFFLHIAILVFMYAGLSSSWNIISGFSGQLSLGHAAYFGLGAYAAGILFDRIGLSPWIGMIVAGIISAFVAVIVGYPSLRLRGTFYTLVTIAFVQVLRIIAINWTSMTGGSVGLHIKYDENAVNMMFASRNAYAFLFLGFAVLAVIVAIVIRKSKIGYYLIAIRENQESAEALGISSPKYKSFAVFASSFLTGIGGALYAFYIVSVEPSDIFSTYISTTIAVVSIVGGLGTIWGPVVGAMIVIPLNELLRAYVGGGSLKGLNLVIYGMVLIIMALKYPGGVCTGIEKLVTKLKRNRKEAKE